MKIAQICPFFYPVEGGMEEHVFQISKKLVRMGYDVEVLTSNSLRNGKIRKKFEIIDGIKVFRFNTLFGLGDFGKFWPGFIFKILKEKYDIVHVHNYRHVHTLLSVIICKIKGTPCILTTHSPFHPLTTRRFLSRLFVLFYDFFLSRIFDPLFSKIILITDSEMSYFSHLDKKKVSVVPNGITTNSFRKVKKNTRYRLAKKFGIKREDKLILFVGRIHPTKGLYFLLQSFYELSKRNKKLKLVVVGPIQDQHYFNTLLRFITTHNLRDSVVFTGFVSEEEKLGLYDTSSVFVLPSIYEPFGIVILEAFARGKPVVAVYSDGPRYLIKNGENGFLVRYEDVESAAKYIHYF